MDEVACFMDWDLEAIVRGCSSSSEAPAAATINMHDPNFSHFCYEQDDDEILCSFPEFSETTKVQLDDLEELYKPFYPVLHPLSTHTIVTSTLSIPKEPQEQFKVLKASENKVILQDLQVPAVSKCKRSKNKNNKVMKQVTASEGVCDAWAWRKYGQKPIKGSPYPRSYYRCSSSKGCLARKQVERSHFDPALFLVTYTAEHNHPHPTRRNTLAGSTRKNNFIVAPPRTPLVVQSIEDEIVMMTSSVQQSNKGLKKEEDFFELLDEVEGAELGDGWFSSTELEEFIGLDQQLALDGSMHAS